MRGGYGVAGSIRALSARKGALIMTYLLYYTDLNVAEAVYRTNRPAYCPSPCSFHDLDDALRMARTIMTRRDPPAVAWEIEGDDGTMLDRREIARRIRYLEPATDR